MQLIVSFELIVFQFFFPRISLGFRPDDLGFVKKYVEAKYEMGGGDHNHQKICHQVSPQLCHGRDPLLSLRVICMWSTRSECKSGVVKNNCGESTKNMKNLIDYHDSDRVFDSNLFLILICWAYRRRVVIFLVCNFLSSVRSGIWCSWRTIKPLWSAHTLPRIVEDCCLTAVIFVKTKKPSTKMTLCCPYCK